MKDQKGWMIYLQGREGLTVHGGRWAALALLIFAGVLPAQTSSPPDNSLWANGLGNGFRSDAQNLTLTAGAVGGLPIFGSQQAHDLALASLAYGHMLGSPVGSNHWFRGNWEGRLELFAGAEFSPDSTWLVGFTPHLRYDFATGTHWIPFLDAGAGVTAVGIGQPDLSSTFEFNLQGGPGVRWFIRDNLALTLEARYFHISDAGLTQPNRGVNGVAGMIGAAWFF